MQSLAAAVAAWPQEGAHDAKYFYERSDFHRVLDGSAYMIVGPKGSGKSSLTNYIERHCVESAHLCHHLDATALNFNRIAKLSDEPTELLWFWRQLLMMSAIAVLNRNRMKNAALAEQVPLTADIGEAASIIRSESFKINFGGMTLAPKSTDMWEDRGYETKRLLAKIGQSLDQPTTVFITVDKLDLGFLPGQSNEQRDAYLRVLSGLVNAAQTMTEEEKFGGMLRLQPVVLLRTDILANVPSGDRTKRADMTVKLFWHPGEIQKLLAHRISVDTGYPSQDFARNWNALLYKFNPTMEDRFDARIDKTPFAWLEFRTQWRPRDYIKYLQLSAQLALEKCSDQIFFDQFVLAEKSYAEYAKNHMTDEGSVHMRNLEHLFSKIKEMVSPRREDKIWFNWQEFAEAFGADEADTKQWLQELYKIGAIGQPAENPVQAHPNTRFRFIYKYQHETELDSGMKQIIVHPALRRALIKMS